MISKNERFLAKMGGLESLSGTCMMPLELEK